MAAQISLHTLVSFVLKESFPGLACWVSRELTFNVRIEIEIKRDRKIELRDTRIEIEIKRDRGIEIGIIRDSSLGLREIGGLR